MNIKQTFKQFIADDLGIPLAGFVKPFALSDMELQRIDRIVESYSRITSLPPGFQERKQPFDIAKEFKTVCIVATPNKLQKQLSEERCRDELRGTASPHHVTPVLLQRGAAAAEQISAFWAEQGYRCLPAAASLRFPLKLIGSRCGIGRYGKNGLLQHPQYGSWLSLSAFLIDADIEPDDPLKGDCGTCSLCAEACPGGALHTPYSCDESRCLNFHLGHNKKNIPESIRAQAGNNLGSACTVCRDVCPANRNVAALANVAIHVDVLHPHLLDVLALDDRRFQAMYGECLMGKTMQDKKFLQRNAAIALGNFKAPEAVEPLAEMLRTGDPAVRSCAVWALEKIGTAVAAKALRERPQPG